MAGGKWTMLWLTVPELIEILRIMLPIPCILSIFGSTFIIISFICLPAIRNPLTTFIVFMSMADLMLDIAFLSGLFFTLNEHPTLCSIQSYVLCYGCLAVLFWSLCFSLSFVWILRARNIKKAYRQLRWATPVMHLVCWGLPFYSTIGMAIQDVTGPAGAWCFIPAQHAIERFLYYFGPLIVVFVINVLIYAFINYKIMKSLHRESKRLRTSAAKAGNIALQLKFMARTSLFLLAFFVTWIWGLTNRALEVVDQWVDIGFTPFAPLYITHTFFTPLQGFLNMLAYIAVNSNVWREWYKKIFFCRHFIKNKKQHTDNYAFDRNAGKPAEIRV